MTRSIAVAKTIISLALFSVSWLSSPTSALAAPATDIFQLNLTGKEWCRGDSRFFDAIKVRPKEDFRITFTHDPLTSDVQATINTHGDVATIDAITLKGRVLKANKSGLIAQLALSGRDPAHTDHFFTIRGRATFNKAGGLTKVAGTFVGRILSDAGGVQDVDCFGSGTFVTGKKLAAPVVPGFLLTGTNFPSKILRFNAATGAFIDDFVSAGSGGLNQPLGLTIGPDGNLYVSSRLTDNVLRYNGTTGAFIDAFVPAGSGGLNVPSSLTFGPDGNLYVVNNAGNNVLRYNGTSGDFIDVFASGGLSFPTALLFGPDGNLYVSSSFNNRVLRYNGTTGTLIGIFASGGGLSNAEGLAFGPDGNLYVASYNTNNVLRYNGTTGAFMGVFASGGGLINPRHLVFRPDGNLYVSGSSSNNVVRYNGTTGAFIDEFITAGSGGLNGHHDLVFIP